jgi:hypothetical protein
MANRQPLPETVKRLDTELTNWGTMVSAIGVKIK